MWIVNTGGEAFIIQPNQNLTTLFCLTHRESDTAGVFAPWTGVGQTSQELSEALKVTVGLEKDWDSGAGRIESEG